MDRKQMAKPDWLFLRRRPHYPRTSRRGQGQWDDPAENLGMQAKAKDDKLGSYRDFRFQEKRTAKQLSWFYNHICLEPSLQFFQC